VPGGDDIMLMYQSSSFHDALYLRRLLGLRRAPEFERWLQRARLVDADGALLPQGPQPEMMQRLLARLPAQAAP
jgi:ethanolamine ammonia-lyase large subunit